MEVKQEYIIAPILFAVMLHFISEELSQGIPLVYKTGGRLFNCNKLKAKRKVKSITIMELQHVDDHTITVHAIEDFQLIYNSFAKACKTLGLALNIRKVKVLDQLPLNQPVNQLIIKADFTILENVNHFLYLGNILSSKAGGQPLPKLCQCSIYIRHKKIVFEDCDQKVKKYPVNKAMVNLTLVYEAKL